MDLDLQTLPTTFGAEREVYDPVNAWVGAPSPIFLQINRMHQGIYQMGYDPEADAYWMRWLKYGGGWADWTAMAPQPPPIEPPP